MSPNINSSKSESSNYNNTNSLHNNYSATENKSLNSDAPKIKITITNHLCNPCPKYYTDVFNKVLIECKHPSHNQHRDWTTQQFD